MRDLGGRTIDYARISITDRCNLRCIYCMGKEGVTQLEHRDILTDEEILALARALASLGIRYLKITGGEPMAREGCLSLIKRLKAVSGIEKVTLTTNGILLDAAMGEAAAAGLDGINISLDALDEKRYARMTRLGDVRCVLSALEKAVSAGIPSVKVNVVPVMGWNEDDLVPLAGLARERPIHVRFIELMPIGCGAKFSPVSQDAVRALLEAAYGPLALDDTRLGSGPASYCHPDGFMGSIGFISALSHAFCDRCNRVRITAGGQLKLCLNHQAGIDLKALLRGRAGREEIAGVIAAAILLKPLSHSFSDAPADREMRGMCQIGG